MFTTRRFWIFMIVSWVWLLPFIAYKHSPELRVSLRYLRSRITFGDVLPDDQVRKIAEETTVLIDGCGAGSGILCQSLRSHSKL